MSKLVLVRGGLRGPVGPCRPGAVVTFLLYALVGVLVGALVGFLVGFGGELVRVLGGG